VPVVVIVLVRVGLVSIEKLKEIRPYVIVGAFIIAAVVTPPDVLSQFLLAVPMWLLYEFGILMAQMIGKSTRVDESAYRAPDEATMNAELDKAEAESVANREQK
jgi:sec-independent protein translocase protein TatC